MKKLLAASVLAVVAIVMVVSPASAQFGAGVKVPPEVFLAYHMSENLMLEAGLPLGGLGGFFLTLAVDANAKLFFAPVEVAEISLKPFLGAGVTIVSVLDTLVFTPHGLAGVEYHLPDTPFSLFGELGVGLSITPLGLGLGVGGAIGARFDF